MKKNSIFKYCASLAMGLALSSNLCASYDVTTVAGSAISFSGDGAIATTARLNNPFGVFVHSSGDVYFSDTANNRIRKITASTGFISTIAGTGTAGFSGDGAAATDANLNNPRSVFVDNLNNVYFADTSNNRIRMLIGTAGTYFGSSRTANFIYTIAGTGTAGSAGDSLLATAASLNNPWGVFVDSLNNLYIADTANNRIRMVVGAAGTYFGSSRTANFIYTVAGGSVTTSGFAGDGASATASNARLNSPQGVFVDSLNNVYIADSNNNRVRMVVGTAGTYFGGSRTANFIYTIAGTGTAGFLDGSATTAMLSGPQGVSVNSTGNVYIADGSNDRIRMLTASSNSISTIAGSALRSSAYADGVATSARFMNPGMLSIDLSTGDLLVPGSDRNVRQISTAGGLYSVSTLFKPNGTSLMAVCKYTTANGTASILSTEGFNLYQWILSGGTYVSNTSLNAVSSLMSSGSCFGIVTDSNKNIYVTDSFRHVIYKIQPSGTYSVFAGTYGSSGAADGTQTGAAPNSSSGSGTRFNGIRGIIIDSSDNLYVSDTGNNTIRKITSAGVVTTIAGTARRSVDGDGTSARFVNPGMLSIDLSTGDLLVPGSDNNVRKVTTAGDVYAVSTLFNYNVGSPPVQAVCAYITSAGVSSIITTDNYSNLYQWIQSGGTYVHNTSLNAVSGPAYDGWGLVVDSGNNIFMTDGQSNRIYKILPNGSYSIFAGTGFSAGSADGTGAAARFNGITGITIDSSNNLYASDTTNNTIRKITPAGVVTTIAETAGLSGSTDAEGSAARFNSPWDIDIDASGNLYIADRGNNLIRKLTLNGATYTASTIAGSAGSPGSTDGTGSAARFNAPTGISVDSSGIIYVSDTNNDTIRKITSGGVVTTVAGLAGVTSVGSTDAIGTAAKFNSPWDIDIDSAGNLYVADRGNNLIRKLTNNSGTYTVSTIAGTSGSSGSADGIGTAALFNAPTGLAVDSLGHVFVTDTGNNTIRRLALSAPPTSLTIEVDGTDSAIVSAALAATTVHKTGAGTSVLSGDNSGVSTLEIDAGLVKVSATNNMGASLAFAGGNMEVTSGTVAVPTAAMNQAGTITTNTGAAVSSIAAPSGAALLTIAGSGVVTAGNMSASATPLSIPGVMYVGASSTSKMPTGVATVLSGGLLAYGQHCI